MKQLAINPVSGGVLLGQEFYERPTLVVARDLLGKHLVRVNRGKKQVGKIVEVEAYIGEKDPACHAFRGLTPRTRVMYGLPGHAYIYFTYGMYFMLNVVTEREGFPAAVLIRAVEPIRGFDFSQDPRPAAGPGKLCRSMAIDKALNGVSLQDPRLHILDPLQPQPQMIRWSPRIGITGGIEHIWRAYIDSNPHVSRKTDPTHPFEPSALLPYS